MYSQTCLKELVMGDIKDDYCRNLASGKSWIYYIVDHLGVWTCRCLCKDDAE